MPRPGSAAGGAASRPKSRVCDPLSRSEPPHGASAASRWTCQSGRGRARPQQAPFPPRCGLDGFWWKPGSPRRPAEISIRGLGASERPGKRGLPSVRVFVNIPHPVNRKALRINPSIRPRWSIRYGEQQGDRSKAAPVPPFQRASQRPRTLSAAPLPGAAQGGRD